MWSIQRPVLLLLLVLIPFAVYMRHFWRERGGRLRFPFQVYGTRGFAPGLTWYAVLRFISIIAFWTGIALVVIAVAGPARVHRERIYLDRGIDIMIVLDESPTMAATDFGGVRRYDGARRIIADFVRNRPNDAIGLVTFAREAALRMPPTTDHDMLLDRMNELQIMELGDGTAIGDGIAVAAMHLRESQAQQRVLILLSDGVNNTGIIMPDAAAELAADLGVRVYTIGIGTQTEVGLDFVDPNTGRRYQALMQEGFDEDELRGIADETGGVYYHASSERTLGQILDNIDTLESTERRSRISVRLEPVHNNVLWIALILLLLEFLVRIAILREVL